MRIAIEVGDAECRERVRVYRAAVMESHGTTIRVVERFVGGPEVNGEGGGDGMRMLVARAT